MDLFGALPSRLPTAVGLLKLASVMRRGVSKRLTFDLRPSMRFFYQVLQAFQNDAGVKVLLISLKAGGVALNLTVANHIFLMDP